MHRYSAAVLLTWQPSIGSSTYPQVAVTAGVRQVAVTAGVGGRRLKEGVWRAWPSTQGQSTCSPADFLGA